MFVIHPTHFLPPRGNRARAAALFFLLLAPVAVGLIAAFVLGQDANWDLRNYHWYNAFAFLNNRYDRDFLPSQTPYFYNPLLDVPFYLLATHVPARAAGFVLGLVQGLNIVLLFMIAHATLIVPNPRQKAVICAALAVLGLFGGGGISLLGTTFGDNLTSLGIFLSAALVVRHLERLCIDAAARALPLAFFFGVPAGMMMGLKLPSVIYCLGLCGGLLFVGGGVRRRFLLAFAFGCGVLAGVAITLGHWAFHLQSHYGSPFFPYFNEIFKSPLEPPVSARDVEYAPHGWRDFLFMPFIIAHSSYRVGEIDWRDWRLPILYALAPLAIALRLFFGRNRKPADAVASPYAVRYLLAAFAIAYATWLAMFTIYRYAVPIEMIAPLLIVFAVGMLPLRLATRGLVAAFILAVVSASIVPGNWHRRDVWLDRFVEAAVPPLADTAHLMILMAGIEPYSHLLPEFPPDISFVRVESNFAKPGQIPAIDHIVRERIDAHRVAGGHFMLLIPDWQTDYVKPALAHYGLRIAPQPCQTVTDRLFDDKQMNLCPVIPQ